MQPGESSAGNGPSEPDDSMERLSATARGWHQIQLAVLGFIGICGVLRSASTSTPRVIQILAGILAVVALAVACVAVFRVGRVAYPITFGRGGEGPDITGARRQLRVGIRLTVAALTLIVVAALSGWWPSKTTDNTKVAVSDTTGQTWCGRVVGGANGTVSISTDQGIVTVPVQTVVQLRPVASCT
jgi:hypothetical protein